MDGEERRKGVEQDGLDAAVEETSSEHRRAGFEFRLGTIFMTAWVALRARKRMGHCLYPRLCGRDGRRQRRLAVVCHGLTTARGCGDWQKEMSRIGGLLGY